jgi:sulfatase modifying factor 1
MRLKSLCPILAVILTLSASLAAHAQLRPETSDKPEKKPAAKSTRIVVETQPNAQVYLDDVFKGQAGPEGRLIIEDPKPGIHKLRVSLEGKQAFAREFTVEAGKTATVEAALADLPAKIIVESFPNAQVYLDDAFKGQAGPEGRLVIEDPKPGVHKLRVSLPGKGNFSGEVSVAAGKEATVRTGRELLAEAPDRSTTAGPASSGPAPKPGDSLTNPQDGLEYVWIPPGTFQMGCSSGDAQCSDAERPSHQVTLTSGFWTSRTLVTVAAYQRFSSSSGRQMPPPPPFNPAWSSRNMPIVNVSWDDGQAYCHWAGSGGRLPTEAEWEYLARGGNPAARYAPLDEVAWYGDNSGPRRVNSEKIWKADRDNYLMRLADNGNMTHSVGQKLPNGFGLYDTVGNVWEWTSDWFDETYYQRSPSSDPTGPAIGQMRVLRGGSFMSIPMFARVSYRYQNPPGSGSLLTGFRCVGTN